jgi:hypothetical protein
MKVEYRKKVLEDAGWRYHRGGVWTHPDIFYEGSNVVKEWSLHEAFTWEKYGIWDPRGTWFGNMKVEDAYDIEDIGLLRKRYDEADPRTWPFFPIVMPSKNGKGPASDEECDKIEWEVWDQFCISYKTFSCLPDAIEYAIRYSKIVLDRK